MSDASPSLGGRSAVRLPFYSVVDRAVSDRRASTSDANYGSTSDASYGSAHSADPVDYTGLAEGGHAPAAATGGSWRHEHGGYEGAGQALSARRDGADLTDLSHSLGDGARYAVDVGQARGQAETPAARAAKLRLRQALRGVRRVCEQAMRQRMHTEMADLASQIRKMHDRDSTPR